MLPILPACLLSLQDRGGTARGPSWQGLRPQDGTITRMVSWALCTLQEAVLSGPVAHQPETTASAPSHSLVALNKRGRDSCFTTDHDLLGARGWLGVHWRGVLDPAERPLGYFSLCF